MAAQFLSTSKLSNIINMITLGRQSGILRVIRGQGPTREIGQIKFVNGEPVSTLLGPLTGANALSVLSNWGECIYAFDENAASEFDSDYLDSGRFSPPAGASNGSWPSYGIPSSYPSSQSLPPSSPGVTSPSSSVPNVGSQPGYPTYPGDQPPYEGQYMPGAPSITAATLNTVPRRTVMGEPIEQLPLDRRERMILLLVDGRRNLAELARLTRRNEQEVLAVIDHLGTLGLVQVQG